jgi:hypothetical protein
LCPWKQEEEKETKTKKKTNGIRAVFKIVGVPEAIKICRPLSVTTNLEYD